MKTGILKYKTIYLVLVCMILFVNAAQADTLRLKSGAEIEGEIVEIERDRGIRIIPEGKVNPVFYPIDSIEKYVKDPSRVRKEKEEERLRKQQEENLLGSSASLYRNQMPALQVHRKNLAQ